MPRVADRPKQPGQRVRRSLAAREACFPGCATVRCYPRFSIFRIPLPPIGRVYLFHCAPRALCSNDSLFRSLLLSLSSLLTFWDYHKRVDERTDGHRTHVRCSGESRTLRHPGARTFSEWNILLISVCNERLGTASACTCTRRPCALLSSIPGNCQDRRRVWLSP